MLIIDAPHRPRFPFVLRVEGDPPPPDGGGEQKPPQFVPTDEFKAFQKTITDGFNSLNEGMRAIAADRNVRVDDPAPKKDEITPEAYADALADPTADGAKKVIADYERQREDRLKRHADERVAGMESTGISALESINISQMRTARDDKGNLLYPHFGRFEKQITDRMKTLAPAHRAQPIAWQQLYRVVIGENFETLVGEEREKVLRAPAEGDKTKAGEPPASAAGRTKDGKGDKPTVRDLGGEDSERALVAAGKDGDSMAKRMGYKDWNDYVEKCKDYIVR